jgi:AcrR family transcriptional regulator
MSLAPPPPRESPRERAGHATRARIFEAALAEFRRVGVDQASITRIASQAGVSRPTFYFHFRTKQDVLLDLEYAVELDVAERMKRCRSLREAFEAMAKGLVEIERGIGSPELFREMLGAALRHTLETPYESRPALVELARHFESAATNGELRPGIDPSRAPLLCMASVYGVQVAVASDERHADFEKLFSLYLDEPARD